MASPMYRMCVIRHSPAGRAGTGCGPGGEPPGHAGGVAVIGNLRGMQRWDKDRLAVAEQVAVDVGPAVLERGDARTAVPCGADVVGVDLDHDEVLGDGVQRADGRPAVGVGDQRAAQEREGVSGADLVAQARKTELRLPCTRAPSTCPMLAVADVTLSKPATQAVGTATRSTSRSARIRTASGNRRS